MRERACLCVHMCEVTDRESEEHIAFMQYIYRIQVFAYLLIYIYIYRERERGGDGTVKETERQR